MYGLTKSFRGDATALFSWMQIKNALKLQRRQTYLSYTLPFVSITVNSQSFHMASVNSLQNQLDVQFFFSNQCWKYDIYNELCLLYSEVCSKTTCDLREEGGGLVTNKSDLLPDIEQHYIALLGLILQNKMFFSHWVILYQFIRITSC